MSDYIVRATAANSQIRAFAAVTTDMVETASHDCYGFVLSATPSDCR